MFTGLVEEIGAVRSLRPKQNGVVISIAAKKVLAGLTFGDSVAVNGVCLTVVEKDETGFCADAVEETIARTTMASWSNGTPINLERALVFSARVGGHFVQGHVDAVGTVIEKQSKSPGYWLTIELPAETVAFCVEKGSIAIDGISLTVAAVTGDQIAIAVIPHTLEQTNLRTVKKGDRVNIETDVLGKYVHRFLGLGSTTERLSTEKLRQWGF